MEEINPSLETKPETSSGSSGDRCVACERLAKLNEFKLCSNCFVAWENMGLIHCAKCEWTISNQPKESKEMELKRHLWEAHEVTLLGNLLRGGARIW